MLELNGTLYKLCCLDTNVLSNLVIHSDKYLHAFVKKFPPSSFIPSFTPFSLFELRPRKEIFEAFLNFFSDYPCLLLKHTDQIFEEELRSYPKFETVCPIALSFSPLAKISKGNLRDLVKQTFELPEVIDAEKNWPDRKKIMIKEIIELKQNFQPKTNDSKTAKAFANKVIRQQVKVQKNWNSKLGSPNPRAFPSYKMALYSVYHRFYIHEHREPKESDVFDFLISGVTPYIDVLVVENFQHAILEQVQSMDDFIKHVRIFKMKDIHP